MKYKKLVIILMIILCILIITTIAILIYSRSNSEEKKELELQEQSYIDSINNQGMSTNGLKPEELKIETTFFTVDGCVNKYFQYISESNNKAIYSLLDANYIKDNNIKEENALESIPKYTNIDKYKTKLVYVITGVNYSIYYVKGSLVEEEVYFVVNMDSKNNAFAIVPSDSEYFNTKINETIETNQKEEEKIQMNDYNVISYKYLEDDEIVDEYFQDYIENALLNPDDAYELIDQEYREKRFGSVEQYKIYVEENRTYLESMCKSLRKKYTEFATLEEYEEYFNQTSQNGLSKYQINQESDKKQYICIDTYGNYYIFNINGVMDYTVILDTYTINLPQFLEKYENGNEQVKVGMNIEKFISSINMKDYKYAYSCLADSFKANSYQTQESFEEYVKSNFFEKNKIEYESFSKEGENYIYEIKISDEQGISQDVKNVTIIMQLKEGTDFVMSFSIN